VTRSLLDHVRECVTQREGIAVGSGAVVECGVGDDRARSLTLGRVRVDEIGQRVLLGEQEPARILFGPRPGQVVAREVDAEPEPLDPGQVLDQPRGGEPGRSAVRRSMIMSAGNVGVDLRSVIV